MGERACVFVCVCHNNFLCLLRKQEIQLFSACASSSVSRKRYYQSEAADALMHRSASQTDAAEF